MEHIKNVLSDFIFEARRPKKNAPVCRLGCSILLGAQMAGICARQNVLRAAGAMAEGILDRRTFSVE